MKKLFFETEKDGFYGTYYENQNRSDCAVIGLFGDDPNDYMAKCGAKWLHKNGVNALCMSPGKKNYSHVNYPLERIGAAIQWLKKNGNRKIGIMGMSTAGIKLKNNKKKTKWTVISGKKNVSLSKKEKDSVMVKAKKVGKAKVQAKAGRKKYIATVKVCL